MAKGLIGGMTDYNHQSFVDLVNDLKSEQNTLSTIINKIEQNVKILIDNGFWRKYVISNFKIEVNYSIKYYKTALQEVTEITNEIQIEVKEHHCKRLIKLSEVAQEINVDIGKIWHQDYEEHGEKDYDDPNFQIVEIIYADTRDMAVSLLDLYNIAERLKDFIGRQNLNQVETKKKFKLELAHKIGIGSLGITIIVLLFGNNLCGRTSKENENKSKTDLKDSFTTSTLLIKGVATLDDLNWTSTDSISLIAQYCNALDNERLSLRQTSFSNESQFLNWIIEKYFGNNLASKDYIKISSFEGGDLSLKIVTNDSLDFPEKFIQVGLNSTLKGKIDDNDILDYVIPFYTSGGGNYYYCQLLFVVKDLDSIKVFRNCNIELNNFRFEMLSIDNRVIKILTYNHNEDDGRCCPSLIDTVKLKYFNGRMIFTE